MKSIQWTGASFWAGGLCFSGAMYGFSQGGYLLASLNLALAIINTYIGSKNLEKLHA